MDTFTLDNPIFQTYVIAAALAILKMLFQAFLLTPTLPNSYLNMLVPVATAALALAVALAGYVMVKFFGVIFLGRPREDKLTQARDASGPERLGKHSQYGRPRISGNSRPACAA